MTALTEVFVTVKPEMDRFGPEVKKKLQSIDTKADGAKVAGRFGVGFNGAFGGIVKHSAGLFVGAFAAIKGAQFLGGFINDARESAKVARVSAQVIKSTGGVAGITAAQIGDLATAISNKTGADDEAIQSGENLLATFTNVRNETGKGNDIFNRATQAAVDMASAMNGGVVDANGLKSANIQLGKALNDPVKGVTALSKVGVSFTQQQKDQIKTLVDSGKTLEAQKIILGEVGKEFGGAAAAAADPLTRLQTIGGNLAEKIGGFLLPTVDKFATFIGDTVIPKVGAFSDVFAAKVTPKLQEFGGFLQSEVVPRLKEFAGFFKDEILPRLKEFGEFIASNVVPVVGNLVAAIRPLAEDVGGAIVDGFNRLLPVLQSVGAFISDTIVPAIVDFSKWLKENSTLVGALVVGIGTMVVAYQAYTLATQVGTVATKAFAVAQAILDKVMKLSTIGIVIGLIVGLAAALVYAYQHSEKFRDIVNGVWNSIKSVAQTVFGAVIGFVKSAIDWIQTNFPKVKDLLLLPFTGAKAVIDTVWAGIKAVGQTVYTWFVTGWSLVEQVLLAPFNLAKTAIDTVWTGIKTAAQTALAWVVKKFLEFGQSIIDGSAKAFGWVPGLGPKLKTAATEFGKFRDSVNAKLAGINDEPVDIKVGLAYTQALGQATKKMKFADGGGVFGGTRGKDSVPALLMPDEHVWTTKEVSAAGGHGAMKRMRRAALAGELNGYANGGVVVHPKIPGNRRIQAMTNAAAGAVDHTSTVMANAIAKQMVSGPGGPPGARKSFRGVTLNQRTIGMLLNAERLLGAMFHITQGSYSTRVAASGSTHAGGGAMDTNGPRGWNTAVAALRKAGFAAWHRTRAQGPWNDHIHSIALGDSSASPAAKAQMASFRRGGDGLGHGIGYKAKQTSGGHTPSYATGAWKILGDQLAVVHKGEMVIPERTADSLRAIIAGKLHRLHQNHVAHQAHVAHLNHLSTTGLTPSRLHPDDIRRLARELAGEIQANPPRVHLDGRLVDQQLSRRALNGGY